MSVVSENRLVGSSLGIAVREIQLLRELTSLSDRR